MILMMTGREITNGASRAITIIKHISTEGSTGVGESSDAIGSTTTGTTGTSDSIEDTEGVIEGVGVIEIVEGGIDRASAAVGASRGTPWALHGGHDVGLK